MDDQLAFFLWLRDYRKELKSVDGMSGAVEKSYAKTLYPRYQTAVRARFDTAVSTETPVFERLVHFWSNHFVVSGAKPVAIALPPSFERDAIRPYVTGRFSDMLLAVAKHPAMLIYLDNAWQEVKARCHIQRETPTLHHLYDAVMEGAVERVRPKMMTVTAIMGGLLPILWGSGAGGTIMRRIAAPMIGGMISSTALTLLVIPAIYALVKGWNLRRVHLGVSLAALACVAAPLPQPSAKHQPGQ